MSIQPLAIRVEGDLIRVVTSSQVLQASTRFITTAGLLATRPAASIDNAEQMFFATDDRGGTFYRSNGASWVQVAAPVQPSALLVAVKNAATTRASLTAATIDTELILTVEPATTYLIDGVAIYESSTVADFKFDLVRYDLGGSAYERYALSGALLGTAAFSGSGTWRALGDVGGTVPGPGQVGGAGAGVVLAAQFSGVVRTGLTAVELGFAWAQNTSEASNTILHPGSFVRLTKLV